MSSCLLLGQQVIWRDGASTYASRLETTDGQYLTIWTEAEAEAGAEEVEPLILPVREVREIQFQPQAVDPTHDEYDTLVTLNRGGWLLGKDLTISEGRYSVMTSWAGELTLKKEMVKSIELKRNEGVILESELPLTAWKKVKSRKKWVKTTNGIGVRARGAISRKVAFPERFHMEFKLKLVDTPRVRILFLATEGQIYEPSSYLQFMIRDQGVMGRVRYGEGIKGIGQKDRLSFLDSLQLIPFDIYVDTQQKVMAVYANGESVVHWALPDALAKGEWLQISSEYEGEVVMEDLRLSEWNGVFPHPTSLLSSALSENRAPLISLYNSDLVNGDIIKYNTEQCVIDSPLGEIELPPALVQQIDLSSIPYEEAKREAYDVIAHLKDGSMLTFTLQGWNKEEGITGYSQSFGTITLTPEAVRSLRFNIYED